MSSEKQRRAGTTETQLEVLRDYAEHEGLEVVREYRDHGVSGLTKLHKRPAGQRLLEDAKEGRFGAVLVYRLDQLGRSNLRILDAIDRLRSAGATVRSIKEGIDTGSREGALQEDARRAAPRSEGRSPARGGSVRVRGRARRRRAG